MQAVGGVDDLHRAAAEHVATAARAAGSRPRRRPPSASSRSARSRTAARCSRAGRAARRSARGPRPGRSRRRSCRASARPASCRPAASLQRRLAAELDDHALGLLDLDDAEDVLERQRLEVEAVGGVVVGRDRLGVAVDHHRVAAGLAHGHRRVHAAVVELDALADAVRARAEDHHARPVAAPDLVARPRRAPSPSRSTASRPRTRPRRCRPTLNVRSPRERRLGVAARAPQLAQEPGVDRRCARGAPRPASRRGAAPRAGRRSGRRPASPAASAGRRRPSSVGRRVELARAHRLRERLLERAADRHRLAHRLHVGREAGVGARELLEREPRPLDDDVVDRRLEARRRRARDVVGDLLERVADREPGGDLGDREARSPSTPAREERDTRGFISMTTISSVAGLTANCTFEPPVSTPTARITAIAWSRSCW